jgi:F-type H+/Na+-transporting ATPase subunit alpha
VTNGYLDSVELRRVQAFEAAFLRHMHNAHPELVKVVAAGARLSPETQAALGQAIDDCKAGLGY